VELRGVGMVVFKVVYVVVELGDVVGWWYIAKCGYGGGGGEGLCIL
jgi:hypothetical protein